MITFKSQHKGIKDNIVISGIHIKTYKAREVDYHKTLRAGSEVLDKLGATYYISAGTALGFIRDGDFIPHDGDIDVEIVNSYSTPINYVNLIKAFEISGFSIIRTVFDGNFPHQLSFIDKQSAIFDIWFVYGDVDDGFFITFTEYGKMKTPAHFIENISREDLVIGGKEYSLPMPLPYEEYCECRYGKDWNTPKTSKDPWQEDAGNLEK
jgi:hypothetical protein